LAFLGKMADFAGVRLLIFRVADLTCAAEIAVVREILPRLPATRLPGAVASVNGIINVRGNLVTLVDARRALGQPEANGHQSIVVLDVAARSVGFAVDEVVDLISVSAGDLAQGGELPGIDSRLVRAVGRRGDLSFVLLDTDALLSPILTS
jgi:purine-binding chemotaxis protein CheW